MRVDLNSDLGESFGRWELGADSEILTLVTSANVACGMHAGDPCVMRRTVANAAENHVAVGAHPGYPDLQGFGRRHLSLSADEAYAYVLYQAGALAGMCRAQGVPLVHVKPHGALYNDAARDAQLARAIAEAVRDLDPALVLVGLPGSELERAASEQGLRFAAEFFCDRGYRADGSLVPRSEPGALVESEDEVVARTVRAATQHVVESVTGETVPARADTVCLHGDGAHAVAFARRVRSALEDAGVQVAPPVG